MNNYESVLILDPTLEESEAQEKFDQLLELYKAEGAEVLETIDWGKRKLAYPIKKKDNGLYRVVRFDAEPSVIGRLERRFRLDERVLRSLTVLYVETGVEKEDTAEDKKEPQSDD
ncbi:MAG: 30S ribosomal protein S6 [Candidatus Glassbacteria bacterium]|nr:30S ribosomal protein S6 [Candidatus Glassbacteria bacterium]